MAEIKVRIKRNPLTVFPDKQFGMYDHPSLGTKVVQFNEVNEEDVTATPIGQTNSFFITESNKDKFWRPWADKLDNSVSYPIDEQYYEDIVELNLCPGSVNMNIVTRKLGVNEQQAEVAVFTGTEMKLLRESFYNNKEDKEDDKSKKHHKLSREVISALLAPRYIQIADYPLAETKKGDIIVGSSQKGTTVSEEFLYMDYPHLFKPLPWYEKRLTDFNLMFQVKFARIIKTKGYWENGAILPVIGYETHTLTTEPKFKGFILKSHEEEQYTVDRVVPATEKEFEEWKERTKTSSITNPHRKPQHINERNLEAD